jgi:Phosphoesterase family
VQVPNFRHRLVRRVLRRRQTFVATLVAVVAMGAIPAVAGLAAASTSAGLAYKHVFLIVEENNGFSDVIGNAAAPNLNYYARHFGTATLYYGVNGTSEPNYVGLLGGSTFGLNSDDAYWKNAVTGPSLISELDKAGVSWKAYLQGLPHAGFEDICFPSKCNGAPDSDPLYVSKHDGIQNFSTSQNTYDWSHQVPIDDLTTNLASGNLPRFSYIVPDECHDMHGDPPYCLDSGNEGDPQNQHLIAVGDEYLGGLVSAITNAAFWARGNNAIVITYDSGDNQQGCCDARPGGGQVANIVITSHGPRGVQYSTPSNHYSLLSTLQNLFGLRCLQFTCDTSEVQPMLPLFSVTGAPAIATTALVPPDYPTPTPTPNEPLSTTTQTPSSGGWTVQQAELLGKSDNSLGGVAASSPTDVWAVGDYLPDAAGANPDATLTLAEHWDGTRWTVVPTPNAGPNFNSFYGVAASEGQAWAVGERLNGNYEDRALVESWDGTQWSIDTVPQPGAERDMLFGASASSPSDVWVVGTQEAPGGGFESLAEHWNGSSWTAVPTVDPGATENLLYSVVAVNADDAWAVGQQVGSTSPDQGLVEHWDGTRWSVVPTPVETSGTTMFNSVTAAGPDVWAVGQVDSPENGGRPLIEMYDGSSWKIAPLAASVGSVWTSLWGVAASSDGVWAVGSFVDPKTDNNDPLLLHAVGGGAWSVVDGPAPGTGSNILGGVAAAGSDIWAAGVFDNGGNERPYIETAH